MATTETITRNLGGNRLGSGGKNNISMHAYNRSTHDLSRAWRSSMNVGTLVPFMKILGLDGDTFSIDMDEIVKTLPSIAPLYGSFKMQMDVFECPIRLYNGLLHNNMVNIGLNMSQVKLPKIELSTRVYDRTKYNQDLNNSQFASDSIFHYFGLKGLGDVDFTSLVGDYAVVKREFNAVPLLAYYDIVKNYYSNKQEEKGVYISCNPQTTVTRVKEVAAWDSDFNGNDMVKEVGQSTPAPTGITLNTGEVYQPIVGVLPAISADLGLTLRGFGHPVNMGGISLVLWNVTASTYTKVNIATLYSAVNQSENGSAIAASQISPSYNDPKYQIVGIIHTEVQYEASNEIVLKTFDLSQIDDMRIEVLQNTGLNNTLYVNNLSGAIFKDLCDTDSDGYSNGKYHQFGLAIKTYQSDLFNNWLKTEWIDGTNGINKITAVDTSSGSFELDSLNLAKKVYNMLNRIAVSGGTYEDWREAVYSVKVTRRAETPVYKGGMSAEIAFSEVVSNAASGKDPLGTLAGKGGDYDKKGGKLEIRCEEPCYIIGIVSITPRIDYSQGNDWDICELDSLDDIHKPELDGIGFEDLLQERMAYWGTYWDALNTEWVKLAAGKIPAWSNYMSAVNETHGTFAEPNNTMFMTLNRRYQFFTGNNSSRNAFGISDLTTYIDPSKYNYIFDDSTLESQNFWVQIGMRITARRVMSAKIIPSL